MIEIHSSYNLLALSKRLDSEKYLLDGLDNDYFIARLTSDKWQILKYHDYTCERYGVGIFKSPEFDFIRFIDENTVEIHL